MDLGRNAAKDNWKINQNYPNNRNNASSTEGRQLGVEGSSASARGR